MRCGIKQMEPTFMFLCRQCQQLLEAAASLLQTWPESAAWEVMATVLELGAPEPAVAAFAIDCFYHHGLSALVPGSQPHTVMLLMKQ
jgi:hypothetical protein